MALFRCSCKNTCTTAAVIISIAVGVAVAFLRFAGVITVAPVAFIVAFGVGALFLAVALIAAALIGPDNRPEGDCPTLTALLLGALGTVLVSLVILGVGFAATSTLGALFTGLLAYFFAQTLTATACWVKQVAD